MMRAQLKDGPGMTTCKTCHRALYKKDVDKQGNCPDCFMPGSGMNPPETGKAE